eukprot:Gregarina_sp_Poly_1__3975@NODE_21_length_20913_cov_102_783268_g19_i0_p5_GENE_NODE_21_length_20913_cov_102_783268_g19_i0NODE_21_length_20913_cov_102_783268_g19_i0_p5_ORF_typecomplete_len432_score57_32Diphthamide_syn/PF01866_17/3e83_NODE_21_length_20913_cov_102_783268_g19_i01951220807
MECLSFLNSSENERLRRAIQRALPTNYNFELLKTLRRIHDLQSKCVCLQLPEGLLVWAESLALIIEEFSDSVEDVIIIGDVTYGGCCIDDIKATALGADFIVHYAHSCLIPIDTVSIPCLYVFVEVALCPQNLSDYILAAINLLGQLEKAPSQQNESESERTLHRHKVALLGSIQFSGVIHHAKSIMSERVGIPDYFYLPQVAPLTPGETLGCTSPAVDPETHTCVFVADGRFHIESAMIRNPHVQRFLRFDPFLKKMFDESYEMAAMLRYRHEAIQSAQKCNTVCLVLSTLGRQGSLGLMEVVMGLIKKRSLKHFTVFMSELLPSALNQIAAAVPDQQSLFFIQIGCPRLSIDWGHQFSVPVLSPYEAFVCLNGGELGEEYPMDYFAFDGGPWSNYGVSNRDGSIAPPNPVDKKARLREKWLAKKAQMEL